MSFWANKLNGEPVKVPAIPSRDMFGVYNSLPERSLEVFVPQPPVNQDYKPSVRLKEGGRCPGCGGDKYMTYGSYAVACGTCGYHPRFEQSGYGERSLNTMSGDATPARQSGDSQTMAGSIVALNLGNGEHL